MRRTGHVLMGMLIAGSLATAPAAVAAPVQPTSLGPAESYLFVVDSSSIQVIPEKGTAGRIVIASPSALEFSNKPYQNSSPLSVRSMLIRIGWSPTDPRLKEPSPAASVSVAGERSRIVDINRAEIRNGKLVLHVICIEGPLTRERGPGSIFISNPSG